MATSGWWIGYGFGGGAALYCANLLQQQGLANYWQTTYLLSLIYIVISILLLLIFVREPCHQNRAQHQSSDTKAMAELLFQQPTGNESGKHTRRLIAGIVLSGLFFSFAGFEALQAPLTQYLGTDNGLIQFLALWVAFMLVAALFVAVMILSLGLAGIAEAEGLLGKRYAAVRVGMYDVDDVNDDAVFFETAGQFPMKAGIACAPP